MRDLAQGMGVALELQHAMRAVGHARPSTVPIYPANVADQRLSGVQLGVRQLDAAIAQQHYGHLLAEWLLCHRATAVRDVGFSFTVHKHSISIKL
jgi:hypothetical protein